jgi:hypothetical protein
LQLDDAGELPPLRSVTVSAGNLHAVTNKRFQLEFCTVARWKNGEIVEEKLFHDQVSFLRQIGIL